MDNYFTADRLAQDASLSVNSYGVGFRVSWSWRLNGFTDCGCKYLQTPKEDFESPRPSPFGVGTVTSAGMAEENLKLLKDCKTGVFLTVEHYRCGDKSVGHCFHYVQYVKKSDDHWERVSEILHAFDRDAPPYVYNKGL